MKIKEGFTLTELLGVMGKGAIVIILVILVFKAVSVIRDSKKGEFLTQVKNLFKEAERSYLSDQILNNNDMRYCFSPDDSEDTSQGPLKVPGNKNLYYSININKSGDIIYFLASNGSYSIKINKNNVNIFIEDIKKSEIMSRKDEDFLPPKDIKCE